MPVQIASTRLNLNPNTAFDNNQNLVANTSVWPLELAPPSKASTVTKCGVFATTLTGVVLALAILAKSKGYSLKPSQLFKGSYKDWVLTKMAYKGPEILTLGAGSVLGGLTGGVLFDKKEHIKAKLRESVIQYIGNISTPLLCVWAGVEGFKKYLEKKAENLTPKIKIKADPKIVKGANEAAKSIPLVIATALCLTVGVFLGNKVGNFINEKIFKVKDNRKIKLSDMSPHIDDACLAISLATSDTNIIGHTIARIIPAALMVSGYSTGTAQEKPERLQ